MMKRRFDSARNGERGSVIILIALIWTTLLALAAVTVDMGHMYLAKRNLQEAADAAVMAGLPTLGTSTATAKTNAQAMATKIGYSSGVATSTGVAGGMRTLTVTITATEPFFFAKALGYSTKSVSATSVGQAAAPVPAVFASSTACTGSPAPVGIQFNGGPVTVTGDVQSNASANVYGTATITGSTTYGSGAGCTANGIPGASPSGGSITSPYTYTTSSFGACTFGSLSTAGTLSIATSGAAWWASGGPSGGTLVSGVYCANGNIDLSGGSNITGTVTLVATGQINISATTVNLTAFSNGIIAYSSRTGDCYSTQAINIGSDSVVMNGSFDAPNGCINPSGTTIKIYGSLIGHEVQLGMGGTGSLIDSSASGSTSFWLYQ